MLGSHGVPRLDGCREACQRRPGLGRGDDVDNRLQRLHVDLDQRGGIRRYRVGIGDHQGDRLTREQRLLAGKRLEVSLRPPGHDRQVRRGQHRDDARHRERGGHIDRADPRVRVDAGHDARVEHPRELVVGGVSRPAKDLVPPIDARTPRPDVPHRLGHPALMGAVYGVDRGSGGS